VYNIKAVGKDFSTLELACPYLSMHYGTFIP